MIDKKPVIGITVSQSDGAMHLGFGCEKAIVAAGGLPLLLPIHIDPADAAALLERCDGILFSGGADMDPACYGEEVLENCGGIDVERDAAEIAYFNAAHKAHLPMFGICRGHQVINVLMGGDLYQDLPTGFVRENALQHRSRGAGDTLLHSIRVESGSMLEKIIHGAAMRTTSTHHQAVRKIGDGLRAVGYAADGVIEALEGAGEDFILTVQWHPELRYAREEHALDLFRALVEAAHRYMENRR